jgi:hypothetical protein
LLHSYAFKTELYLVYSFRDLVAHCTRDISTLIGDDSLALRADFLGLLAATLLGDLRADLVVDHLALIKD